MYFLNLQAKHPDLKYRASDISRKKKAKFPGIFRGKFQEKSADFAGKKSKFAEQSADFAGEKSKFAKKSADFAGF